MRFNAPARFEQERDLLHHLVALAPPSLLAAQGGQGIVLLVVWLLMQEVCVGEPHWEVILVLWPVRGSQGIP